MNYDEMFGMLNTALPDTSDQYSENYNNQPGPDQSLYFNQPTMSWEDAFNGFKTTPVLYNVDGFISPYSANNWGGTSNILRYIDDSSRLPALENKIDPNKIFSSEINALRALAADQHKITKMFEKRLMESLNEKGKVGLTEEDVEAMSALTAARSAITSINKEQVNIKKNIADIRVKQNQNNGSASHSSDVSTSKAGSNMDVGRFILDNIFDASATPQTVVNYQPQTPNADPDKLIDSIVQIDDSSLRHESDGAKTYVVVGDTDDDVAFVTYGADGNVIDDMIMPDDIQITSIDRDARKATDNFFNHTT